MKLPNLTRSFDLNREAIDEENRTIELSFSSEAPVERWFGNEILDHGEESVDLVRLMDGAPLLLGHDTRDQIGIVESASIVDRKGRAIVRFGSSERASEVLQDVVDGIRKNVSVGYSIRKMALEDPSADVESYRATDWQPHEISIVSVPADQTIGIGRASDETEHDVEITYSETKKEHRKMPTPTENPAIDADAIRAEAKAEAKAEATREIEANNLRVADLTTFGRQYDVDGEVVAKHIEDGKEMRDLMVYVRDNKAEAKPDKPANKDDGAIGLTEREADSFSFVRMINAMSDPGNKKANEAAAFELEVCRTAHEETVRREIRSPRSEFVLPHDILSRAVTHNAHTARAMQAQRDLVVGTATAGGNLVATDLVGASFIDILRNSMVMMGLASVMTDLVGDVEFPRQTAQTVGGWLATEQGAATEDDAAFDKVALTPQEVGVYQEYSRKLMIQSSIDIEAFVRMDLALAMALSADFAAINGSGASGQPLGIMGQSGVGAVEIGANGGAPTWGTIVDLETEVSTANADLGRLGYLINAPVRGTLKQTEKLTGNSFIMGESGRELNGYQAAVTNQVPSNLTKGSGTNLSAAIFGNFADCLIGMWSGADIIVNPYTGDTTRTTRVTVYQDMDVAVRHPESFAVCDDIVTS